MEYNLTGHMNRDITSDGNRSGSVPHDSVLPRPKLHSLLPATAKLGEHICGPDESPESLLNGNMPTHLKRQGACEVCRAFKVRCEPISGSSCKRCAKSGRKCIVAASKKRGRKGKDDSIADTDSTAGTSGHGPRLSTRNSQKIAMGLEAAKAVPMGPQLRRKPPGTESHDAPVNQNDELWRGNFPRQPATQFASPSLKRQHPSHDPGVPENRVFKEVPSVMAFSDRAPARSPDDIFRAHPSLRLRTTSTRPMLETSNGANPHLLYGNSDHADVINRGILTEELAYALFDHYINEMAPHLPFVVLIPGITATEIRSRKPLLFLSILSVASGISHHEIQSQLTAKVMKIYAKRALCSGEKNLELIQAMQVSSIWYWPPEHFEELRFYELINLTAIIAIDIGLGRSRLPRGPGNLDPGPWKDHPGQRSMYSDPESLESRRTWLGCYFLSCNVSMGLKRPNLIRWTPFMEESVQILEASAQPPLSDKILCQLIRNQRLAEEIGECFSMESLSAGIRISNPNVQHSLKAFERKLELWREQIPVKMQTATIQLAEHAVNMYMHEIALNEIAKHLGHNVKGSEKSPTQQNNAPFTLANEGLLPAQVAAFSICLTSIDHFFQVFLSLDVEVIKNLPIFHYARLIQATIVLINMYFITTAQSDQIGTVIQKKDIKVREHLSHLQDIFRITARDDRSRRASKFLVCLDTLSTWFNQEAKNGEMEANPVGSPNVQISSAPGPKTNPVEIEHTMHEDWYAPEPQLVNDLDIGSEAPFTGTLGEFSRFELDDIFFGLVDGIPNIFGS